MWRSKVGYNRHTFCSNVFGAECASIELSFVDLFFGVWETSSPPGLKNTTMCNFAVSASIFRDSGSNHPILHVMFCMCYNAKNLTWMKYMYVGETQRSLRAFTNILLHHCYPLQHIKYSTSPGFQPHLFTRRLIRVYWCSLMCKHVRDCRYDPLLVLAQLLPSRLQNAGKMEELPSQRVIGCHGHFQSVIRFIISYHLPFFFSQRRWRNLVKSVSLSIQFYENIAFSNSCT